MAAILFISTVFFRTFVVPSLTPHFDASTYQKIDKLIGMRARKIMMVNVAVLLLSGGYILMPHLHGDANMLLYIKITVGLVLGITFYFVPQIMQRMKEVKWFSITFHYLFFSLMMVVVMLAKFMFV